MAPKPKYTPEELEKALEEYFAMKEEEKIDKNGKKKKLVYMSIYDVCAFLDVSYDTWERWAKKPGYAELQKRAFTKIINNWMPNLFFPGRNARGTMFYFNNTLKWFSNRREVSQIVQAAVTHTVELGQLPDGPLKQLSAALQALEEQQETIDVTPDQDAPD